MIDITHIPFSRYGAYLAVTRDEGKDGTGGEGTRDPVRTSQI